MPLKPSVRLRRLSLSDAPVLAKLANNREVSDQLRDYFPYPYREQDAEVFIRQTKRENPTQTFAITAGEDLCGVIGLVIQRDVYRKSAELGYWIGQPFWDRGIATAAVTLLTGYAFETLDLCRIYAGVFSTNKASQRVLEKNGFQREGIFRCAVLKKGIFLDEVRYAKLREDE